MRLQICKEGTRRLTRFNNTLSKFHRRHSIHIIRRSFHICRPPMRTRAFIITTIQTPVTRMFRLRNHSAVHRITHRILRIREAVRFKILRPHGILRISTARLT